MSRVYKFKCGRCNSPCYGETDRYIDISQKTFNEVTPSVEVSMHDHLLFYNHSPSFGDSIILAHRINKFLMDIKHLLINHETLKLNKSNPLHFIISIWQDIRLLNIILFDCMFLYASSTRSTVTAVTSDQSWLVWVNGWVFVYELSGCGFEFRYNHIS